MPASRINNKLIPPSAISDTVTAVVTLIPAFATTRTSTPRPSAAIEIVVSVAAVNLIGPSQAAGTAPL